MTTKAPKKLSDIYGKGYFYGENSGYPAIGYDQAHPSWKEAIDFVKSFKEIPMQWLDVGCAFGYFLKEADEKGVSAFGVDISEYALQQLSDLPSKRSQSLAESLPFRNDTFDVVTAFDLVEHLYNPAAGLEEMVRVLKPGGVFLLTTPDPLLFNRDEETHFSEKPPSFWMKQMDTLGLTTRIRFFGEPFNVEILAIKRDKNSPTNGLPREALAFLNSFNHDYFGERADILQVGPGPGYAVLRAGWSALHEKTENQSVRYFTESATLYIYNDSNKPMEVAMNIRCGREVPIKIYTHTERIGIERMQEEDGGWRIEADRFLVSPGGHQIELRCDDKNSVEIQAVFIDSTQKDYSEYNTSLPVDQYQRYKILQDTVNIIREQHRPQRILEVGGSPGQLTGFLPDDRITIADMEYCDIPDFQYADGLNLPFTDESFDIAASIDVLEHIAPKDRKAFITELVRVSKECVFLGAPFADPALREAEHILSEFIHTKLQHTHRFLDEHLSNPLPNREETIRFFQEKGLDTIVIPNGHLSHWLLMIIIHFYLGADPQLNQINRKINQYYNKYQYPFDNRSPAYRYIIIGCKQPLPENKREALARLLAPETPTGPVNLVSSALLIELLNVDLIKKKDIILQQLTAQNAYLGAVIHEKDAAIQNLITHSENLQRMTSDNNKTIQELTTHSDNLMNMVNEKNKIIRQSNEEIKDLEGRLMATLEQNSFLAGRVGELETSLDSYYRHSQNLEQIVNRPLIKFLRACKRIIKVRK